MKYNTVLELKEFTCYSFLFTDCKYSVLHHCRNIATCVEGVWHRLQGLFLIYQLTHALHSDHHLSSWSRCNVIVLSLPERNCHMGIYPVTIVDIPKLPNSIKTLYRPYDWALSWNTADRDYRQCGQVQCNAGHKWCSKNFP
jgi:hypothetical protein